MQRGSDFGMGGHRSEPVGNQTFHGLQTDSLELARNLVAQSRGSIGLTLENGVFDGAALATEWQSTGNGFTPNSYVSSVGAGWTPVADADFNGTGASNLIFQKGTTFTEWQATGNGFTPNVYVSSVASGWTLAATASAWAWERQLPASWPPRPTRLRGSHWPGRGSLMMVCDTPSAAVRAVMTDCRTRASKAAP